MEKVTPDRTKQLAYPCAKCGVLFYRRPGGRKNCSKACAKAVERQQKAPNLTAREKRIKRRKERLLECAFGYWFIDQAKRAGTVQTFQGSTAIGLSQLYAQYVYRKKRYGWIDGGHGKDMFHLCHVQALKGRNGSIGLTIPENIFTGIAELNQRQGNKPVNAWAGASLPATARKRKWDITDEMSRDEVLGKISDFLGTELDKFLDGLDRMPQRTIRLRLARSVFKHQGDEMYEPLERDYTLTELESLNIEDLQALDAIQQGRTSIKAFSITSCPTDSRLGVMHDELARFSELLPDGEHRNNCRFMLRLVRILGTYLVQANDSEGKARSRFLRVGENTWSPLRYYCPSNPWGPSAVMRESDIAMLTLCVIESAQAALQGLDILGEKLEARLVKRLHLQTLRPLVVAPNSLSWEKSGSNWLSYIDGLYDSFGSTWQALLDVGLCTEAQVLSVHDAILVDLIDAVERSRKHYREQLHSTVYNVPFDRYPPYLEFPPIIVEPVPLVA